MAHAVPSLGFPMHASGRSHPLAAAILAMFCLLLIAPATADAQERLDRRHHKNGSEMRAAFSPIISKAGQSTVRIQSDGEDLVLGVIVAADGLIATKASEVQGQDALTCHLADGRSFDAKVVALYNRADVALLKIDANDLPVIGWADDDVAIGQWAITAGVGDDPLAVGIVSVMQRRLPEPAIMGIMLSRDNGEARVRSVSPDSGADKAGMQPNDVITQLADRPVSSSDELIRLIQDYRPGDVVRVHLTRGEEQVALDVTLAAPPTAVRGRNQFQNRLGGELSRRSVGFEQAIQHDTVLRPVDCGGPLVNLEGRAIGLNIARSGRTESYALPAPLVQRILNDFAQGKYAVAPAHNESRADAERQGSQANRTEVTADDAVQVD